MRVHGACPSLPPTFLFPGMKILSYLINSAFPDQEVSPSTERSCFPVYVVSFNISVPSLLFSSWKAMQGCVRGGGKLWSSQAFHRGWSTWLCMSGAWDICPVTWTESFLLLIPIKPKREFTVLWKVNTYLEWADLVHVSEPLVPLKTCVRS